MLEVKYGAKLIKMQITYYLEVGEILLASAMRRPPLVAL